MQYLHFSRRRYFSAGNHGLRLPTYIIWKKETAQKRFNFSGGEVQRKRKDVHALYGIGPALRDGSQAEEDKRKRFFAEKFLNFQMNYIDFCNIEPG